MKESPLETLLRSRARVQILRRLLFATGREFYQRELALLEGLAVNAVKRELPRLARAGFILVRERKGRKFFRANPAHGLYREVKTLLLKAAIFGPYLTRMNALHGKIDVAFVYGSFAKGQEDQESDVDLLVVSELPSMELYKLLEPKKELLGAEFNPRPYNAEDFRKAAARRGEFLDRVLAGPVLYLIGGPDDVRRLIETGSSPEGDGTRPGPGQSP